MCVLCKAQARVYTSISWTSVIAFHWESSWLFWNTVIVSCALQLLRQGEQATPHVCYTSALHWCLLPKCPPTGGFSFFPPRKPVVKYQYVFNFHKTNVLRIYLSELHIVPTFLLCLAYCDLSWFMSQMTISFFLHLNDIPLCVRTTTLCTSVSPWVLTMYHSWACVNSCKIKHESEDVYLFIFKLSLLFIYPIVVYLYPIIVLLWHF